MDNIEDNEVYFLTLLEQKGGLSDFIWILATSGRLKLRAVEGMGGKFQNHQKALEKLPEASLGKRALKTPRHTEIAEQRNTSQQLL